MSAHTAVHPGLRQYDGGVCNANKSKYIALHTCRDRANGVAWLSQQQRSLFYYLKWRVPRFRNDGGGGGRTYQVN